ncbi:hypothetical protein AB0J43_05475 [Nonomuraea fuscirosea]
MHLTEADRLERIASLLPPCPPPDVWNGMDLCSNHGVRWPCAQTEANWLARGLDRSEAQRAAIDALPKPADYYADPDEEYDPAEDDEVRGSVGGGV